MLAWWVSIAEAAPSMPNQSRSLNRRFPSYNHGVTTSQQPVDGDTLTTVQHVIWFGSPDPKHPFLGKNSNFKGYHGAGKQRV
jgi:hypothetical protein